MKKKYFLASDENGLLTHLKKNYAIKQAKRIEKLGFETKVAPTKGNSRKWGWSVLTTYNKRK